MSAKDKIGEGLKNAIDHAQVTNAVYAWLRDDAPLSAKMNITPGHVGKLVDRICGSITAVAPVQKK